MYRKEQREFLHHRTNRHGKHLEIIRKKNQTNKEVPLNFSAC